MAPIILTTRRRKALSAARRHMRVKPDGRCAVIAPTLSRAAEAMPSAVACSPRSIDALRRGAFDAVVIIDAGEMSERSALIALAAIRARCGRVFIASGPPRTARAAWLARIAAAPARLVERV